MHHFAYLDPGTGSIILQAIVGFGLGVIVVLRTHIGRLFGKHKSDKKDVSKKAKKSDDEEAIER